MNAEVGDAANGTNPRPLAGRSVLVTRTREQAKALSGPLEALGAEVLVAPVIAVVDPDDWGPADAAVVNLESYDWAVFTSTNAVDRFFERLHIRDKDARAFAGVRVACVGSATADALAAHGITADYVPRDFHAEGLVAGFAERGLDTGERVLIPRALEAREVLPDSLREMGAIVDVVPVYRTVAALLDDEVLARIREGAVDVVTFTSGSTVRNFLAALEAAGLDPAQAMSQLTVASIGPVTTKALRDRGLHADIEASEGTMSALAAAVAEACRR